MAEDLRHARPVEEAFVSIASLHPALANRWFRSRVLWSAKDKAIPRALAKADPTVTARFDACIASAPVEGGPRMFADLAGEVLEPDGGFPFDGHTRPAASWRLDQSP